MPWQDARPGKPRYFLRWTGKSEKTKKVMRLKAILSEVVITELPRQSQSENPSDVLSSLCNMAIHSSQRSRSLNGCCWPPLDRGQGAGGQGELTHIHTHAGSWRVRGTDSLGGERVIPKNKGRKRAKEKKKKGMGTRNAFLFFQGVAMNE